LQYIAIFATLRFMRRAIAQRDKMLPRKGFHPVHTLEKINTAWFKDRLADKKISQRKLARLLDLDPAGVSYMLRGLRAMKLEEAAAIATLLGQPLDEVLRHAGVPPPKEGKYMIRVGGHIDATGVVHIGSSKGERLIVAPPGLPEDAIALRFQTSVSAAMMMNGWVVYSASPGARKGEAGSLCVAQIIRGPMVLGLLERGYGAGLWNVLPWVPGGVALEGVMLEHCAPVLWIKT
jgi:transcriptional regulator with XRE-family HTH domain